jgi:hypothetical protein
MCALLAPRDEHGHILPLLIASPLSAHRIDRDIACLLVGAVLCARTFVFVDLCADVASALPPPHIALATPQPRSFRHARLGSTPWTNHGAIAALLHLMETASHVHARLQHTRDESEVCCDGSGVLCIEPQPDHVQIQRRCLIRVHVLVVLSLSVALQVPRSCVEPDLVFGGCQLWPDERHWDRGLSQQGISLGCCHRHRGATCPTSACTRSDPPLLVLYHRHHRPRQHTSHQRTSNSASTIERVTLAKVLVCSFVCLFVCLRCSTVDRARPPRCSTSR